jgi:hypothetical protein
MVSRCTQPFFADIVKSILFLEAVSMSCNMNRQDCVLDLNRK